MSTGAVSAADGFAMTMVLIVMLGLGVVALLVVTVFRHRKTRESPVDELLDELRRDEEPPEPPPPPSARVPDEPWEKQADWWKS